MNRHERIELACGWSGWCVCVIGGALVAAAAVLAAGGCAQRRGEHQEVTRSDGTKVLVAPGTGEPDRTAPTDFWLSVTVAGPARAGGAESMPRAMRPARYVMEPDHQLRAALGMGAGEQTFPPPLRRLSSDQVDRLWRIVDDAGLMAPGHPCEAKGLVVFETLPSKTMYVVNVFARGERRQFIVDGEDGAAPGHAAAKQLADELSKLSWLDEATPPIDGGGMPVAR